MIFSCFKVDDDLEVLSPEFGSYERFSAMIAYPFGLVAYFWGLVSAMITYPVGLVAYFFGVAFNAVQIECAQVDVHLFATASMHFLYTSSPPAHLLYVCGEGLVGDF